jgi:hypothetical protein
MPFPQLDRHQLLIKPLGARSNKVDAQRDFISPETLPGPFPAEKRAIVEEAIRRVRQARADHRPVMLAFGAHAIKNGLGPVMIRLMEEGWITHLATNGAGVIHDWEFAYQGQSSEDVRANVSRGQFGIWQETGFYINLAIVVGAWRGLGYGESVGALVQNEGLMIPDENELRQSVTRVVEDPETAAAAADLLGVMQSFKLRPGFMGVAHPSKSTCVQAAAYRLQVPFTAHPMIGHDIIYTHPMNHGAAIGRTALRDFLSFSANVRNLDGGVYFSVGSAVMSPMIFEKAMSMSQNLEIQAGRRLERHWICVVDLAEAQWDWQNQGEPPATHPAYYLRYCKTFSRMGGTMRYLSADNRDFLLALYQGLRHPA